MQPKTGSVYIPPMTRPVQKKRERFFAEQAARSLGKSWSLSEDREHPDFIVTEGDQSFGLEIREIFMGPQSRAGSAMKAKELASQRKINALQLEYEAITNIPLNVKFVGDMSAANLATVIPAVVAEDFPSKPVTHHIVFDSGTGLRVHVTKALRPEWYSVNDRAGFVDRNSLKIIADAIEKKAEELNTYMAFAGSDIRLLQKIGTSHWNPEQVAGANTTFTAPSLAKIGNASAIAAQGPNNSLMFYWQKIDTTQWNSEQVAGRGTTLSAPSLAQVGNASAITAQGPKDQLMFYWQTIDTTPWHGSALAGTGTVTTPAIAQIRDSTVIVAVDANANLYYYWQTIDTKQWHPEQAGTVDDKQVTPSVAQVGNSSAIAVPLSDATGAITLFWQKIDTTPWTAERVPDSVNPVLGLQGLQISN